MLPFRYVEHLSTIIKELKIPTLLKLFEQTLSHKGESLTVSEPEKQNFSAAILHANMSYQNLLKNDEISEILTSLRAEEWFAPEKITDLIAIIKSATNYNTFSENIIWYTLYVFKRLDT